MSRIAINDLKYNEPSSIKTLNYNESSEINGGWVWIPVVILVVDNWAEIKTGFMDGYESNQ